MDNIKIDHLKWAVPKKAAVILDLVHVQFTLCSFKCNLWMQWSTVTTVHCVLYSAFNQLCKVQYSHAIAESGPFSIWHHLRAQRYGTNTLCPVPNSNFLKWISKLEHILKVQTSSQNWSHMLIPLQKRNVIFEILNPQTIPYAWY